MMHPKYPKIQIPAARIMGVGRQPALPASVLDIGDNLVLDYGAVYRLQKKVVLTPQRMQLVMAAHNGNSTHRTVTPTTHVAVSWGTFNKHWTVPKTTGGKTMAKSTGKTGKKINLTGGQLDLRSPINTGVSFNGKVDLTKQTGTPGILKGGKKIKY
jgi:hypothetical protein